MQRLACAPGVYTPGYSRSHLRCCEKTAPTGPPSIARGVNPWSFRGYDALPSADSGSRLNGCISYIMGGIRPDGFIPMLQPFRWFFWVVLRLVLACRYW